MNRFQVQKFNPGKPTTITRPLLIPRLSQLDWSTTPFCRRSLDQLVPFLGAPSFKVKFSPSPYRTSSLS